jgi:hypothetical protein
MIMPNELNNCKLSIEYQIDLGNGTPGTRIWEVKINNTDKRYVSDKPDDKVKLYLDFSNDYKQLTISSQSIKDSNGVVIEYVSLVYLITVSYNDNSN